jgi:tetratricopeptide (TPR) repeat protein
MRLSRLKRQYLKAHFRRYSNAKLAKALGVDKSVVRAERERSGLVRTADEEKVYRDNPHVELPPFTGQLPVPDEPVRFGRLDYLTAGLTALFALVIYTLTLGPTVTGEDSGELVTAAYTLGIAHPPGYPLWCILGHLFTYIPFGTVAWRVNLMSATFGALTVFVVCLMGLKVTRNRVAATAGALAFAFSAEFWDQSVITEVYTLNAFLIAVCVVMLLVWYDTRQRGPLFALAAAFGFGVCNHNTMHFLAPFFIGCILFVDREPWKRWKLYAACVGVSLLPLSIYAYLPIRSLADPPVDWGNPETLAGFWDVVSRKQYSFGFTENARTGARFVRQCWAFLTLYTGEFTPWLAWVPVAGAVALWRRNRLHAALFLGLFFYIVLGFIAVLNFDIDKESLWLNNVFWIPAYMAAALFIGAAIDGLSRLTGTDTVFRLGSAERNTVTVPVPRLLSGIFVVAAAAVCITLPLVSHYYRADKSDYYFGYDFGMNVLNTLDENAIYIPTADHATFPAIYLQSVEGLRPDVTIGNKYGYPEESLYQDMPEETRNQFRKIPTDYEEQIIEDWIIAHTDRPVYFSKKRSFQGLPEKTSANTGLLYQVVNVDDPPLDRDLWSEYTWHTLEPEDTRGDLTAEFVLSDYHFARGRDALATGDTEAGLEHFRQAIAIAEETKEGLNNIGSALAEAGMYDEAIQYYAKTLKIDPEYDFALRNLGKLYFQQGQPEQALTLFERILAKRKIDPEALWFSAQCLRQTGNERGALDRLQFLSQITPQDDKVFRELGMIYFNDMGDQEMARRMFSRSLSLNPNQPELTALVTQAPSERQELPRVEGMPELPGLPSLPGLGPDLPQLPQLPGPNIPQVPSPPAP